MLGGKRRFVILAFLMVLLVGAVSAFSTRLLYQTALEEQKKRLHELVQSQASLVSELGLLSLALSGDPEKSKQIILKHLSRAHSKFQLESDSGEFTIAMRVGPDIRFLIVHGKEVQKENPVKLIPFGSPLAEPMQEALHGETGTIIAHDYRGVEVLAAYTPLFLQYEILGLVAKIDIAEIKTPFIRANITIFGVGVALTLICIALFFKISEPIIRDLHISERNYRDLVEGANTIILRLDKDGIISFANGFAQSLLFSNGMPLVGRNFASFTKELPTSFKLEDLVRFFEEKELYSDMPILKADGNTGWVSWAIKPILTEEKITELLCIGTDVTKAHLASEAQKEIEERFRGIAKASPVGIIITDMEGNLLYANERMHKMTKTTAVDLIGRGWLKRVSTEYRQKLLDTWFHSAERNRSRQEFRLTSKENDELWILGQIVELKNTQDEGIGEVLTFTDITAIKEADLAQIKLSAAIEQAAEMIIIADMNADITYVNPAFERITGYSREDILGKNPKILQSGEQSPEFYQELWDIVTAGGVWNGRFINIRKNGQRYTQESTIGPIRDNSGSLIGYVGVARDISKQLVVEAQLRQAQKLESIGELAAGIAHEINTPTQYVTTNLQFLEDSFKSYAKMLEQGQHLVGYIQSKEHDCLDDQIKQLAGDTFDQKELDYLADDIPNALAESEAGLKRIAEIVQSVKQLAHPGEVNKSYHDLNMIVRDAVTVSTNEWKYVADIKFELDEDLPQINCLKGEVGQVVLNLIINGAHAIEAKREKPDDRGTIVLKTRKEKEYAVLEVSDSGTGIPQDVIGKIFDPFFTTKDVGKGTGQGLAITYNVIVNMHKGFVDVTTEEGMGSTFTIKLPFDDK